MPHGRIERWGTYDVPGIGPRGVRVYVPAWQAARGRGERSVLVLFDGQNAFADEGSFAGGWHAHRAAETVVTRKRPAPIVVAIDHGYGARQRELSPFGGPMRGDLDSMVAFLRSELAPEVRARFGVSGAPAHWLVGGASMGGSAALYTHFAAPDVFGGALCMSPSIFGLNGRRLLAWVAVQPLPWASRLYLDCGVGEGRGTTLPRVAYLASLLRARGYGAGRLRFRRDARGRHNEVSWRRRLPGALRFLIP